MPEAFPAALLLPGDAFDTSQHQVMGRRVAGRGFAEAMAASLRPGERLELVGFSQQDLQSLASLLQPRLPAGAELILRLGLSPSRLHEAGALHLPDPGLARWGLLRATSAPHAFSLSGVIHTVCSETVLTSLEQLYSAPLHPWDALVCTSRAGQQVVQQALEGFRERLSSRLGVALPPAPGPTLPIIPLGLDPAPFQSAESRHQARRRARQSLGLPADAYVVLFVGRLSFHSKAHPLVLYRALNQLALEQPGVVLLECGHLFNAPIAAAYDELAAQCPDLQVCRVGGLEPATEQQKQLCLAAADVFCSPADNLQETFGLSILEAMAAELPVLASDWNGYRDLVEPGVTGELVPTTAWFPPQGQIDGLERDYRLGFVDYDTMIGLRSLAVAVDPEWLLAVLRHWREQPQQRQALGLAGRQRLERQFSWSVVAEQYRQLWQELAERRDHARRQQPAAPPEPGVTPYRTLFAHYPSCCSDTVQPQTFAAAASPPAPAGSIAPAPTPPAWLRQAMQQHFLTRLVGADLEPLIQHLERHGRLDADDLAALGIALPQQPLLLQALRKLGVLV